MFHHFIILTAFVFVNTAVATDRLTEKEILNLTSLTSDQILKDTEKELEAALFHSETGRSCGLEEFTITGYVTNTLKNPPFNRFTVVTEVTGPIGECDGSGTYACYTDFILNKAGVWAAVYTDCDSSFGFND